MSEPNNSKTLPERVPWRNSIWEGVEVADVEVNAGPKGRLRVRIPRDRATQVVFVALAGIALTALCVLQGAPPLAYAMAPLGLIASILGATDERETNKGPPTSA